MNAVHPYLRLGLALLVLAWLLGPYWLRTTIPFWMIFALAVALELHFLSGGLRPGPARRRERSPLAADRERYGYGADGEPSELLLVREGDEELWIPYSGESGEELAELLAEARNPPLSAADEPDELDGEDELEAPRSRRLPAWRGLASVAFVAALGLVLWLADRSAGWEGLSEPARAAATARFSDEASRIAGKPVTIRCDEAGRFVGVVQHADGVAVVGGDLAYLTPERCVDLYRLAFRGEVRGSQTARSLAVLAHEAWHLRGERDEGTTECYALQSAVGLGVRLGLSEGRARQLMRQQLVENSLRRGAGTEYVVPAACRDGGPLDLDPGSSRFP